MDKIRRSISRISLDSGSPALLALVAAILTSVGANVYCWNNAMFSHDSWMIDQSIDTEHNYAIGRFLIPLLCMIRGWWASPVIVGGVEGTLFLSLAIAIIVNIMSIILQGEKPKLYGDRRNVRDHAAVVWVILTRGRLGVRIRSKAPSERKSKLFFSLFVYLFYWAERYHELKLVIDRY